MTKTNNSKTVLFALSGFIITILGLIMVKNNLVQIDYLQTLPYLMIGIGCGIFGHNFGEIIRQQTNKKYPEEAKRIDIELKDERNLAIANKSKAKAFDLMIYVYGAVLFSLALMQADFKVIIILTISYLFVTLSGIYFRADVEKEM